MRPKGSMSGEVAEASSALICEIEGMIDMLLHRPVRNGESDNILGNGQSVNKVSHAWTPQ